MNQRVEQGSFYTWSGLIQPLCYSRGRDPLSRNFMRIANTLHGSINKETRAPLGSYIPPISTIK